MYSNIIYKSILLKYYKVVSFRIGYSQEIQIYDEDFNSIKTLEYRITPNDFERNQTISCTCISYSVENEELVNFFKWALFI